MAFKSPIGIDDFKKLIKSGCTYVDKSLLIEEVLENPGDVQLLLRPRRFGKTLNMSMLSYFFNCRQDNRYLFKGLGIEERPCFEKCGGHPTIFLSFKNLNESNFPDFLSRFRNLIAELYIDHDYLMESINPLRHDTFIRYAKKEADITELKDSLLWLSKQLRDYHEKGVVFLIDEYDSPILEGYRKGYYDEIIDFMREVLSSVLKSNTALEKAVLTGILRVSKESIFSGLNHVKTYSVQSEMFSDKFGFTEAETDNLLKLIGHGEKVRDVQDWYNGYQIGSHTIYNPWSLLNFLQEPEELRHYWLNTSSNTLIHELLLKAGDETQKILSRLIAGERVTTLAEEHTSFRNLDGNALWTLLLYSGYLTSEKTFVSNEQLFQIIRIPNREVLGLYKKVFIKFFHNGMGQKGIPDLLKALTMGDIDTFGLKLADLVGTVFSYYDTAGATPERVYHAFILGLLSHVQPSYHIRSNRESGFGRYDVMMIPKDPTQAGFVFEFKAAATVDDLEQLLETGLKQIEEQNYRAELEALGIDKITEIAVAFCGKEVRVRARV